MAWHLDRQTGEMRKQGQRPDSMPFAVTPVFPMPLAFSPAPPPAEGDVWVGQYRLFVDEDGSLAILTPDRLTKIVLVRAT